MATDFTSNLNPHTVDLTGLPDADARYVRDLVETLRHGHVGARAAKENHIQSAEPVQLLQWPGTVIGTLRREDIYDDVC